MSYIRGPPKMEGVSLNLDIGNYYQPFIISVMGEATFLIVKSEVYFRLTDPEEKRVTSVL